MDEAALAAALEPHCSARWPLNTLLILCREWNAGTKTTPLGEMVRATKHAAIGKVHRLIDAGILAPRPSPITGDGSITARCMRAQALPSGARTLPPLASERVLQP